jgi:hypothetical protein
MMFSLRGENCYQFLVKPLGHVGSSVVPGAGAQVPFLNGTENSRLLGIVSPAYCSCLLLLPAGLTPRPCRLR